MHKLNYLTRGAQSGRVKSVSQCFAQALWLDKTTWSSIFSGWIKENCQSNLLYYCFEGDWNFWFDRGVNHSKKTVHDFVDFLWIFYWSSYLFLICSCFSWFFVVDFFRFFRNVCDFFEWFTPRIWPYFLSFSKSREVVLKHNRKIIEMREVSVGTIS